MLKKSIICILVVIMIMLNFNTYAAVPVTRENLKQSMEKVFKESFGEKEEYEFTMGDGDYFIVKYDNKDYKINFDLNSGNPRFFIENVITKDTSYTKFKENGDSVIFFVFGYAAIADIQGVESQYAYAYSMITLLEGVFNLSEEREKDYKDVKIVSDDYVAEEGEVVIRDSEYGEKMIEIYDDIYKEPASFTDECNTYTFNMKNEYVDENTRKIVFEMIVNPEADFSKIVEYIEEKGKEMQDSFDDSLEKLEEDITVNEPTQTTKPVQGTKPTQNNISKIPYAGLETNKLVYILGANIIILLIGLIIFVNKRKKKN